MHADLKMLTGLKEILVVFDLHTHILSFVSSCVLSQEGMNFENNDFEGLTHAQTRIYILPKMFFLFYLQ